MLYGMSTIEIIENLIIENLTRKSGDTTVRMTADEIYSQLCFLKVESVGTEEIASTLIEKIRLMRS